MMKRFVLTVMAVLLCVMLLGCGKEPVKTDLPKVDETVTPSEMETPQTPVEPETIKEASELERLPQIEEPFISIIKGEKTFYLLNDETEIYISDFVFPYSMNSFVECVQNNCVEYTLVDMDSDEINELVLQGMYGDKLVLKNSGETVIGKSFSFRNMDAIYSDGTFSWNYMDAEGLHYGSSQLQFTDNHFFEITLFSVSTGKETTGDEKYYIKDTLISKEVWQNYANNSNNTKITFYKIEI